jgi:hypothetical protein
MTEKRLIDYGDRHIFSIPKREDSIPKREDSIPKREDSIPKREGVRAIALTPSNPNF